MARKKKSDIEILVDIIEGGKLAITDYQWIEKIVARKVKNRQPRQGEVYENPVILRAPASPEEIKDASEEREAAKADGGGPIKSSSGKKDKDGYVGPKPEEVREEGKTKKE